MLKKVQQQNKKQQQQNKKHKSDNLWCIIKKRTNLILLEYKLNFSQKMSLLKFFLIDEYAEIGRSFCAIFI
jgi:hypothetical protein